MPGIRTISTIYREMADSYLSHMQPPKKPPLELSNPLSKYHLGKDPNINIIDGIHKIKGRSTVNVTVSNYTNKHLTFHKGEYIGHLEPLELKPIDQEETHQTNSITLKKMMSETVTSNTFNPPCHEISTPIQNSLTSLIEE